MTTQRINQHPVEQMDPNAGTVVSTNLQPQSSTVEFNGATTPEIHNGARAHQLPFNGATTRSIYELIQLKAPITNWVYVPAHFRSGKVIQLHAKFSTFQYSRVYWLTDREPFT